MGIKKEAKEANQLSGTVFLVEAGSGAGN